MTLSLLHCSREALDEQAEAYVLGHLAAREEQAYEEHLLLCQTCRDAVETVQEFIDVFRHALTPAPQAGLRA